MDIAHPLTSLIPSLDAQALEVLTRIEGDLSLAEIHRLSGRGSRSGLEAVLSRLVLDGLVTARPAGRGAMYAFNRDHVLAPAILAAAAARTEIITRLQADLREWNPPPVHASVFGSFARREGGPLSDIDIVVVVPDGANEEAIEVALDDLQAATFRWSGNRLETLLLTPNRIAQAPDERVFRDIAEQGIWLVGLPWSAVLSGES